MKDPSSLRAQLSSMDGRSGPLIMGILNRTPDSFSDGGQLYHQDSPQDIQLALRKAQELCASGAHILDIGGESTRPGAKEVSEAEEADRVLPLLSELVGKVDAWISVDTQRAGIAAEALRLGASMVNDVSAGLRDGRMLPLLADADCPCVLMHMQGKPETMQDRPEYMDVVDEVREWLLARKGALLELGHSGRGLLLDPGIGFGKKLADNQRLFSAFAASFEHSQETLLLGASRKSFIAGLESELGEQPSGANERIGGSLAAALIGARQGYQVLRVHDVAATVQALRVQAWVAVEEHS